VLDRRPMNPRTGSFPAWLLRSSWVALGLVTLGLSAAVCIGCDDRPIEQAESDAGSEVTGLPPEQASRVVAKAGEQAITLGDFANTLDRMNEFDRLRYKTKERRRELLDDMVDVELLVQEARRRGLDQRPDVQEAIRLVLRDAMLSKVRSEMPSPAELPAEQVKAYYEAHLAEFVEPERRRVSALVLTDKKEAETVLKAALAGKSAEDWGALYTKYGEAAKKGAPADLAGDLGIVGPPDDARGANKNVPAAVRAAAFQIAAVGGVATSVVESEGKHYVVRLSGLTKGHTRTLAEADRAIRVKLLEERQEALEKALEDELRKKYPVVIDEQALSTVKLPPALDKVDWTSGASWRPTPDLGEPLSGDAGAPGDFSGDQRQ
jgi:peptidyl-prolyl cis-trans isomerase C